MKKAYNQHGKLINIINSIKTDIYKCPICKDILKRKFGISKQYFAHTKNKNAQCELKFKLIEKEIPIDYSNKYKDILIEEYYNKKFGYHSGIPIIGVPVLVSKYGF